MPSSTKSRHDPPTSTSSRSHTVKKKTMAGTIKSFFNSARQTLAGPLENAPIGTLFTKVDPAVDGDDCDHDCSSCTISYPKGFKIDEDDELYGHVKGWSTHVLVATGKTDWVRDVADEKGSIMQAIDKSSVSPSNGVGYPLPAEQFYHASANIWP